MLVLTRRADETVVLMCGDTEITVKVVNVFRHNRQWKVKLGFEAPRHVDIWRGELEVKQHHERSTEDHSIDGCKVRIAT